MFRDGLDIVALMRNTAAGCTYSQIDGAFLKTAAKAGLLKKASYEENAGESH